MAPTKRRKPLSSQSKEILLHLYEYFKEVVNNDKSCVTTPTQLVATSTGISLSSVKRVLLEAKRALGSGGGTARPPGIGVGRAASVRVSAVNGQSNRGRNPATISATAVQTLAIGWSMPNVLTQAHTQQVPRLAQFPNSAITMAMGQQAPPPLVRSSANTATMNVPPQVTGTMNGHSTSHSADNRKRLAPIRDINVTGDHKPYKVQKALVENIMIPCINAKPYQYTELLMTLPDLASQFFPGVSLTTCRAMLDALGLTLYRPNSKQLQVLLNTGKCKTAVAGDNSMALVQLGDVIQHMLQFKYMLRSGLCDEPHHAPRPAHA